MRSVAISILSFCLFVPSYLNAGPPTDQIQTTLEAILAILRDPQFKAEAKKKERRVRLRQLIYPRFDFSEMAKRSLGSHWRRLTLEQQREFSEIFTDLLETSYVNRIEGYSDEKFVYAKESQDGNFAEVNTKVITRKNDEFSINYKLYLVKGDWKVYDVVVENISLVNNYRAQFNRIMTNSSYEELVRRMRERQLEVGAKKKSAQAGPHPSAL